MHVYFSGIGAGTGPSGTLAHQAGYDVTCSDKQDHEYIDYLKKHGIIDIHIGQMRESIELINAEKPIDWLVYSSAVEIENPNHPELVFARENNVKTTKRDELISKILEDSGQKMIAIAGTHGKTTTTAMVSGCLNN
jgi:UDP-N-acetylmuramate--alanine ligase